MKGTDKAHENGEAMGLVGVRLTAQLGWGAQAWHCDSQITSVFLLRPLLHVRDYSLNDKVKDVLIRVVDDIPSSHRWQIAGRKDWMKVEDRICEYSVLNNKSRKIISVLPSREDKNFPAMYVLSMERISSELTLLWLIDEMPWSKAVKPLPEKPSQGIGPFWQDFGVFHKRGLTFKLSGAARLYRAASAGAQC